MSRLEIVGIEGIGEITAGVDLAGIIATAATAEGGPGLHHVGYRVDDVAAAVAALVASGREVLDEEPVDGPRESKVAFLHPDAAFGVLVQLVER